jgi:hypothetical protein
MLELVLAPERALELQSHHLDDPAGGGAAFARDALQFAFLACGAIASAQSREDAVDIGHETPGMSGASASAGWCMPSLRARRKLSSSTAQQ